MNSIILKTVLGVTDLFRKTLSISDDTMQLLFAKGFENMRWQIGRIKMQREFLRAKANVPAYRDFNSQQMNTVEIPVIDKNNYVKKYTMDERCVGGKIPTKGVIIDESSGSSGLPTNWTRGLKERKNNARMLQFGMKKLLGDKPLFVINAFALGPWATGVNVTISFNTKYILKSLGPDASKIENTLKIFGNNHEYAIMGYPPFLKMLVDNCDIKWDEYKISFIYGGEGMSEQMREYFLEKGIQKVYGSYGASDLELNIGSENDFTIQLRKLLINNDALAQKVLKHRGHIPMIFQYNPMDFFIETNEEDELLISLCRPNYLSPKLRYNIHDRGHVMRIPELIEIFEELELDTTFIDECPTDLPLLFHYGRADMAVAFYGCKITPTDVNETIYKIPELASIINSFAIVTYEDVEVNKKLVFSFELKTNFKIADKETIENKFLEVLQGINQDFRESYRITPDGQKPTIEFLNFGEKHFAKNDIRIKHNYIVEA